MRLALPLVLVLCGCGGFDNTPLTLGEVKGRLSMVTSSKAFVAVLGAPQTKQLPDASGAFTLRELSPGSLELVVVGGEEWAARPSVQVDAARVVDLGEVSLLPAGEVEVLVRAPDHQRVVSPTMTIEGTPWQQIGLNQEGRLEVEGMPRGCWTVTVASAGLRASSQEVCINQAELKHLDVDLPATDGNIGSEGCGVSGCEFGYACETDGACR